MPSNRRLRDLERTALFQYFKSMADLPAAEFELFATSITVQEFDKGDTFVKTGDVSRNVGFVLSGGFQVAYITDNGIIKIRNFCLRGSSIGSYSTIIENKPTNVEIKAFEPSTAAVIDFSHFETAFDRHWSWDRIGRKIAEQHYIRREDREFQFLTKSAEERYQNFVLEYPDLGQRITQATIASYIGITPVALSRILNRK